MVTGYTDLVALKTGGVAELADAHDLGSCLL